MDMKFGMKTDHVTSSYFYVDGSVHVNDYINGDSKNSVVNSGKFRVLW
jgi:hypothetical protein